MNETLIDALENSLTALEQGQTLDAVLARHPNLAKELRPLLQASLRARALNGSAVPKDVQGRGRVRLLQRVGEMREARHFNRPRTIPAFPRLAISFALVFILVLASTGLVSASSASLPGDQLYPVKRTWESTRLILAFSAQERDVLQSQYQQERLNETNELLSKGRSEAISFSGLVTRQDDGHWLVSGVPVSVTDSTRLPGDVINNGAPVMVSGTTRTDGTVEADEIQILQSGASFPPLEPSDKTSGDEETDSTPIPTMVVTTPAPETNENEQEHQSYEFSGTVESMDDGVWSINGQAVSVEEAEIIGNLQVGSYVKFEGYYAPTGEFVVTRIEVISTEKPGASKGNNDEGGSGDGGDSGDSGDNGGDGP